jgi:hypothetical protein
MGIRSRIARVPIVGRVLNQLLEVPNPFFHGNSPARAVVERLLDEAFADGREPRILNIGSQSKQRLGIINLDIVQNGWADVLADATFMPLADNSIDLIINVAVMERAEEVCLHDCVLGVLCEPKAPGR